MAKEVSMPDYTTVNNNTKRVQLVEEVRQVLFEGMKKAEQARDWILFNYYADFYRKING